MAIPNRKKLAEYFAQLRRVEKSRSAKAEKNIQLIYKEMLKNLREFLGVQYAKYAEDDALTYSALASKGRYARFLEEVQQQVDGIIPKVNKEITTTVTEMYDTAYQGMVRAVSKSANNKELEERLKGLTLTRPEVIKAATTNPVAGLTLSSTLEENRKKIIYDINKNVTIGIMNGDRMSTMANRIKSSVDENYRKAMLIARTEVHRVRETGHNDAAMDIDNALSSSTEYRLVKTWKNMQDNAVRRTELANHWVMEGKTVLMDEEFDLGNGVLAPCPGQSGTAYNDCNCRCYLSHDLVSDAEFFELTGRHFTTVPLPEPDTRQESEEETQQEEQPQVELEQTISQQNIDSFVETQYKSFDSGQQVNEFFYYDDDKRGLMAKRNSEHGMWKKSLSAEEQRVISDYTGDAYSDINNYWRKYGDWQEINKEKVLYQTEMLDNAISRYNLKEPIKVYRAIQPEAFEDYFDDIQQLVGKTYQDKGFMSSSPTLESSAVNKECIMELFIPSGKGRGAYINDLAGQYVDKEYEFLIARNSEFNIMSVEETEEKLIFKMEMIVND